MNSSQDTIFALSSGSGKAGVAVVRLSGRLSGAVVAALCGSVPAPRRAVLRSIRDRNGTAVDRGLVLWLPGPGSFTGEDMAEFQVHGGRSVVAALVEALAGFEGLRPAEAGEFARRAFVNGKLDLTEVEGLADLIDAETEAQRRQALRQLEGRSGEVFEDWRRRLIGVIALCEAGIDFVDEDDVPVEVGREIVPVIGRLKGEMDAALADRGAGEAIREGVRIAIAGPPNVGKSSLINALARRDVAIVSEIPGTTRDAIEVRLDIAGVPVTVVDTAGIRDTSDAIEQEGVRRAEKHAQTADLVLWMVDATGNGGDFRKDARSWRIANKIDLVDGGMPGRKGGGVFAISAKDGAGLEALLTGLSTWVKDRIGAGTDPLITRARHRQELWASAMALSRALELDAGAQGDLVAEELRAAANALGRITGRIDVEDVLDAIFGQFCIGK